MTNMERRLAISEKLRTLRHQLLVYLELLLRDLPDSLQWEIRSYPVLQPITSGGLEPIQSIINRIDWAIYYLRDPKFPANRPVNSPVAKVLAFPAVPKAVSSTPINTILDFGPFDPQKKKA